MSFGLHSPTKIDLHLVVRKLLFSFADKILLYMKITTEVFFYTFILLKAASFTAGAQQTFDLSAQIKTRPEIRRGYQTLPPPGSGAAFFISQRTRLSGGFSGGHVKIGLILQDVRVWGEEPQVADVASFSLHEGWAEIGFGKHMALKAGRQELVYDDHRLFGNLDWVQQGRSHDAAVFKIKVRKNVFHFGCAYNQASATLYGKSNPVGNYTALGWFWHNRKFVRDKIELSFYAVADGLAADTSLHRDKTFFRGTTGPMLNFVSGRIKANATFFSQFGKDIFGKKIAAIFASAYLDCAATGKLNLALGYEYLSGNDPVKTASGENRKFNTLYATNHLFYGYMDYFLDLPKDTKGGGLQDAFLKLKCQVLPGTTLALDTHYFLLANQVRSAEGRLVDLPLGTELDLTATHKINACTKIQFGFSAMFAKASLEVLSKVPGGSAEETGSWGYVMLVLDPTLFKSEKGK